MFFATVTVNKDEYINEKNKVHKRRL